MENPFQTAPTWATILMFFSNLWSRPAAAMGRGASQPPHLRSRDDYADVTQVGGFAPTQCSCASVMIVGSRPGGPCTAIFWQPTRSAEPNPVGVGLGFRGPSRWCSI